MIRRYEIIFQNSRSKKKIERLGKLNGDSGVGQASEFPFNSSKKTSNHKSSKKVFLLVHFGSLLMLVGIFGFLFQYWRVMSVEIGYRLLPKNDISKSDVETNQKGGFGDVLSKTLLGEIEGVPDENFSIIIPKIRAKGKIVANVDASDASAYMEALKIGVAHAQGTGFPGSRGENIYLFAHSTDDIVNVTRFNAIFFLLRELIPQDEVEVYYGGAKHKYIVTEKKIVEPTDVSYLSQYNSNEKETLILQTCWPPGTTLKRLLVFAQKPVVD